MNNDNYYKENPSLCFQCAKCSSGCPIAAEMDILPHQIIHLLAMGKEADVLTKKTPWLCAGCFACATRCPNNINITAVMDHLRQRSIESNIPCPVPGVLTFHQTFINDISRRGRIYELRMMAEYNLRMKTPFKNVGLLPKMVATGKLHLTPPAKSAGFRKWARGIGLSGKKKTSENSR